MALRRFRNWVVGRARHVFTPSAYLRDLVVSWGLPSDRVSVMPNPAPGAIPSAPREELRRRFRVAGATLAFAGRLTAQKSLGVMLDAVAASPGVTLLVAGDGEEADALAAGVARLGLAERVRLLGPVSRAEVLDVFAAADASVLSSSWENFPHSVVEAAIGHFFEDEPLRERLRANAAPSVDAYRADRLLGVVVERLAEAGA